MKKTALATYLRGMSFTPKESKTHKHSFSNKNIKMGYLRVLTEC